MGIGDKRIRGLRLAEFAFPGEVRDRLVAAILAGEKTATSSLEVEYAPDDPVPAVGERFVVVDSEGRGVAIIETTELRVVPMGDIDLAFAHDEGEGFETVAAWRELHERYWRSFLDVPLDDATRVVAERFRLIARIA